MTVVEAVTVAVITVIATLTIVITELNVIIYTYIIMKYKTVFELIILPITRILIDNFIQK